MARSFEIPLITAALVTALSGCSSAAHLSEEAIRRASFDRVHVTPFSDRIEAKACRESLDRAFGFPRKSLDVKAGVHVEQIYSCKGESVVARVSLKNLNPHTMYCAAFTEAEETGALVGPNGTAFFEYDFVQRASYDCFEAS